MSTTLTALGLLKRCRRAGIDLAADGDSIAFDAPPGVAVPVDELVTRKAELLALLAGDYAQAAAKLIERIADDADRADWLYRFDERAGIIEYDGGLPRGEAERLAYLELADAAESEGQ